MAESDYLEVLRALQQIPFPIGRKLLVDFLLGRPHDSIERNRLNHLSTFGALGGYTGDEVTRLTNTVLVNGLIEQVPLESNRFIKVYKLTSLGNAELKSPTLQHKRIDGKCVFPETIITEKDKELFNAFDFFLKDYNDHQKKAMTSSAHTVLCVAGAGSGKTTVLTKRIEFLIRFRSVDPGNILAITFTRKARQEMMSRLKSCGVHVAVETFNSFCESILLRNNDKIYSKKMRVITYSDKLRIMGEALAHAGKTIGACIDMYYSAVQQRGKEPAELAKSFMNDCFNIMEYYKCGRRELQDLSLRKGLSIGEQTSARLVYRICTYITDAMKRDGLRDYSDQLIDALRLFRSDTKTIPQFTHVLVDEYQDVNDLQVELLDLLNPPNIFCVGDPRQSIFGWRGADVRHILQFDKKHRGMEVITLTKNYRSCPTIVQLINKTIATMRLPDLAPAIDGQGSVVLVECDSDAAEQDYVIKNCLHATVPRSEIFVLARTHRQLAELSTKMAVHGLKHIIRREEEQGGSTEDMLTLATVHAIKGMEASVVFVLGCAGQHFPCKASDHPLVDMVKGAEYDKEEEERRLFYVALSRAKKHLHLTYTGHMTHFITNDMKMLLETTVFEEYKSTATTHGDLFDDLKQWRKQTAQKAGMPAFVILHDSALLEIAMRQPSTLEELGEIKGIGPVKLGKYGADILQISSSTIRG